MYERTFRAVRRRRDSTFRADRFRAVWERRKHSADDGSYALWIASRCIDSGHVRRVILVGFTSAQTVELRAPVGEIIFVLARERLSTQAAGAP